MDAAGAVAGDRLTFDGTDWTPAGPAAFRGFSARCGGPQSLPAGVATAINYYAAAEFDDDAAFAAGTFTAPAAGRYLISGATTFVNVPDAQVVILDLRKNGSLIQTFGRINPRAGNATLSGSAMVELLAGDQLALYGISSAAITMGAAGEPAAGHFSANRIA